MNAEAENKEKKPDLPAFAAFTCVSHLLFLQQIDLKNLQKIKDSSHTYGAEDIEPSMRGGD